MKKAVETILKLRGSPAAHLAGGNLERKNGPGNCRLDPTKKRLWHYSETVHPRISWLSAMSLANARFATPSRNTI